MDQLITLALIYFMVIRDQPSIKIPNCFMLLQQPFWAPLFLRTHHNSSVSSILFATMTILGLGPRSNDLLSAHRSGWCFFRSAGNARKPLTNTEFFKKYTEYREKIHSISNWSLITLTQCIGSKDIYRVVKLTVPFSLEKKILDCAGQTRLSGMPSLLGRWLCWAM